MSETYVLILRWAARVSAVVVAAGYFILMAGELLSPHSGGPQHFIEWLGIVLLSAAMVAALLAWVWEFPAALVSLACLTAFVSLIRMGHYAPIVVMAIPGFLYVSDWLLRRSALHRPT